ncbi:hypothetical protein AADZ91_13450 [Colwelliaceae bacterium 6441]
MKCLTLAFLLTLSSYTLAATSGDLGLFVKNEINDNDFISGIGSEVWLTNDASHFGMAVNSAIGYAEVTDTFSIQHSYFAWDFGLKFGYFSDLFIYAEAGFDLGELILHDRDEDDYDQDDEITFRDIFNVFVLDDYYDEYDRSNDIDGYIGAGVGFKYQNIVVESFVRYRQVDGEYWKADNQVFTGIKLTLTFN